MLGGQLAVQRIATSIRQTDIANDQAVLARQQGGFSRLGRTVPIALVTFQHKAICQRFAHDLVVFNEADAVQSMVHFVYPEAGSQ